MDQGQRQRGRHRHRTPDRVLGRPAARHPAQRDGADRRPLRPPDHVRGRRPGQRHHHRAAGVARTTQEAGRVDQRLFRVVSRHHRTGPGGLGSPGWAWILGLGPEERDLCPYPGQPRSRIMDPDVRAHNGDPDRGRVRHIVAAGARRPNWHLGWGRCRSYCRSTIPWWMTPSCSGPFLGPSWRRRAQARWSPSRSTRMGGWVLGMECARSRDGA